MGKKTKGALRGLGKSMQDVGNTLLQSHLMQMREQAIERMRQEYGLKLEAGEERRHQERMGVERAQNESQADYQKRMAAVAEREAKTKEDMLKVKDKPTIEKIREPLRDDNGDMVMIEEKDAFGQPTGKMKPFETEVLYEVGVGADGQTYRRKLPDQPSAPTGDASGEPSELPEEMQYTPPPPSKPSSLLPGYMQNEQGAAAGLAAQYGNGLLGQPSPKPQSGLSSYVNGVVTRRPDEEKPKQRASVIGVRG